MAILQFLLRQETCFFGDIHEELPIAKATVSQHLKELTQKEVAQKMGISQSYISRLEKRIMLRLKKEFLRQTSCA